MAEMTVIKGRKALLIEEERLGVEVQPGQEGAEGASGLQFP